LSEPVLSTAIHFRFALLLVFCSMQLSAFAEPPQVFEPEPPGYVFDVTVNNAEQLNVILERADSLREFFDPGQHGRIAIVLHGDELKLFQKQNYTANMTIVDKARLLDKENIIDIKACQTMMRTLEIEQSDLPDFVEQVPFAPVEIKRLQEELGFTRL
jgi:intracellular sulfur oxidation DsrE/DsrF family protein